MKILIIDDEPDICFILSSELTSMGHESVTFTSALMAQEYLLKENPDAILCDFKMPRMSGLELFIWLKTQGKKIPFYILTGEPTMEKEELLKSGISDILFKPQDLLRLSEIFK